MRPSLPGELQSSRSQASIKRCFEFSNGGPAVPEASFSFTALQPSLAISSGSQIEGASTNPFVFGDVRGNARSESPKVPRRDKFKETKFGPKWISQDEVKR